MSASAISRDTMSLGELMQQQWSVDVPISGLQLDSRKVAPGDVFLAIAGESNDGRDFIKVAVDSGASAILAESGVSELQRSGALDVPLIEVPDLAARVGELASRFYGYPSRTMFVAGITGTNGKTTSSRLAAQLLRAGGEACGVIGTLGAVLDDAIDEARNTTPDAVALQERLAVWRGERVQQVVMEVSSHSLVQGRVSGTDFDVAVFTNLSHDHLDYHGTMAQYASAKAQLFQFDSLSHALINADDAFADVVRQQLHRGVERLEYSAAGKAADLKVSGLSYHGDGIRAQLHTPWGSGQLHSPLPASFNLANLLAAIAVACIRGADFQQVLEWAPKLQAVPGRMEYVANERGLQLIVDYSHTPDALLQALAALRRHTRGRLICVFGCGGDRDAEKRPLMGRVATEYADHVIVTSDNPRRESPQAIAAQVISGCEPDVEIELDRAVAIAKAVRAAQPGDCVLVAGKGHESYQQVGDERLPFSDVQQLRLVLANIAQGAQS